MDTNRAHEQAQEFNDRTQQNLENGAKTAAGAAAGVGLYYIFSEIFHNFQAKRAAGLNPFPAGKNVVVVLVIFGALCLFGQWLES